jgi:hypothetical protein
MSKREFHLAQDKEQWRTLLDTVMKLHLAQKAGNFFSPSEKKDSAPWS